MITAEQAMVLVRERGRAMADAAAVTPTGMTAVLGGDRDEVLATLGEHGLTAANVNGAGQIVAAGTLEQLAALAADPPARARGCVPLQVAGAFHTEHMAPAVDDAARRSPARSRRTTRAPGCSPTATAPSSTTAARCCAASSTRSANPVRWDLCMQTMADLGVTGLIELPPAGTLTGLAKRALPGRRDPRAEDPRRPRRRRATWSPARQRQPGLRGADLAAARRAGQGHVPQRDRRRRRRARARRDRSATVGDLRDEQPRARPARRHVVEWLVEDGDPVAPGQPIVRLHPEAVPA